MAEDKDLPPSDPAPGTAPRWRFRLIVVLLGVVVAAVVARAARGTPEERAQASAEKRATSGGNSGMTTGLVPGGPQPGGQPTGEPQAEEKEPIDVVLPFISEGGIAMILGLLLGMITRSFLKVMFLFAVLGFVALQYLNYKGVITIDWGAMKDFVLNIVPKGASLTQVVQQKLPALGAFGLGYLGAPPPPQAPPHRISGSPPARASRPSSARRSS
jgi:uncharacterized membrane protein (Fun14 family)